MENFFKTMHTIANLDKREFDCIKDLTIAVAKSGNYRRELYTYKNGKVVERTRYGLRDDIKGHSIIGTWDDCLVAKWFCYFEHLFKSKLYAHPEFEEYYTFILFRTFNIMFESLQLDKITNNGGITKLVNMSLANRIGEVLGMVGSSRRLEAKNRNDKTEKKIAMKYAINHMASSLDNLLDSKSITLSSDQCSDILIDLNMRLNSIGKKLLNALLFSGGKVTMSKLENYIKLDDSELASSRNDLRKQLKDSFEIIKNTLRDYVGINSDYAWDKNFKLDYAI